MLYNIDLHVHVATQSSTSETMDPSQIATAGLNQGLSGIVLANRNRLVPLDVIHDCIKGCNYRMMFYSGCEVTCAEGDFLVIGLRHDREIYDQMPTAQLARVAEKHGAVMIWVHPERSLERNMGSSGLCTLLEICHAIAWCPELLEEPLISLVSDSDKPVVAGSDAHQVHLVGSQYTRFTQLPKTSTQLAVSVQLGLGSLPPLKTFFSKDAPEPLQGIS